MRAGHTNGFTMVGSGRPKTVLMFDPAGGLKSREAIANMLRSGIGKQCIKVFGTKSERTRFKNHYD